MSAFILSFVLSVISFPLIRWLSFRTGRISLPRKDRWNTRPTPSLGGISMFLGCMIAFIVITAWWNGWQQVQWALLIGALISFALGLYDDFKRISPPAKLIGQILAATVVIFFGNLYIHFFPWPIANIVLTFFWLVGISNAINLLDNMDGLAGGVSFIAACMLIYFLWGSADTFLLVFTLSLAGAILGFLVFNFPPARIFMGDSGSLFLGFSLAAIAVARRTQASNVFAVIGVPTMLFLLPILETTFVTITRILRGQSPSQGGTDHTSHRLIAFGLSERQAVLVLYFIAIVSGIAGATLEALDYDLSLVLIPLLLIFISLFAAYLARLKMVTSFSETPPSSIMRLMSNLTYKRRLFEIMLDLLIVTVSYYLAFWTRYGLNMTTLSMQLFLRSWPIALGAAYLAFFLLGVYRGLWRYVSIEDLLRFAGAVLVSMFLTAVVVLLVYRDQPYTLDVFLFFGVFLLLGLAGSRSSFLILDRIFNRSLASQDGKSNILIYGAEDEGEFALRWILRSQKLYNPVGLLDDDPNLQGKVIHGVNVLGGHDQLAGLLDKLDVEGVIVSSSDLLEKDAGEEFLNACRTKGLWVRVLRMEFELIE